jgi:type VI secretion system secreted protein VgrG
MPAPKDGTAQRLVVPAAPRQATDADDADPGEVESTKAEQRSTGKGKYGSTTVKPYKPPSDKDGSEDDDAGDDEQSADEQTSWIEIQLLDSDDQPLAGEPFEITLPDGSLASGTLDEDGLARLDGIEPGNCEVTFPRLDGRDWTSG